MESEIKRTRRTWKDLEKTALERCGCRPMPPGGQKVKKNSCETPFIKDKNAFNNHITGGDV
jgi:hypothetical protein